MIKLSAYINSRSVFAAFLLHAFKHRGRITCRFQCSAEQRHTLANFASYDRYMGRRYKRPNFRKLHTDNVSVDDEGRLFLFGFEEIGPVAIESRFHFYEAELTEEEWARVRKRHKLGKKMRHSCYSHGVRLREGRGVGPWVSPALEIQWLYPPENF